MREREIHQAGRLGWLVAGLGLLLAAWAVGNAPFTSPDEAQHFVRAASLVRGDLVGGPPTSPTAPATGRELARLRWQRKTTRTVTIPARLNPAGLGCNALYPDLPATCSQAAAGSGSIPIESSVGTYDPLPYVAPGLATLVVTSSATAGLRAARLAAAALALALLALGLSAAGSGFWSRLGLCLALTPGGLFVLSGVGANSLEIASASALSLALFRCCLTRVANRRLLVAMAIGGFAMAASRPTSVIWLIVAAAAATISCERPRELLAARGARAVVGAWIAGILVCAIWNLSEEPSPPHGMSGASLRDSIGFLPELLREWVGVFGSLDTRPSPWLALPIAAALATLLAWAFARCGPRIRAAVALLALAAVVLPLTLDATVLWFTGFALQGRHVMALAVMAPILAGAALDVRRTAAGRATKWAFAGIWAATQVAYWLVNVHRHAVGEAASWSFLGAQPAWLPGPVALWLGVTALGAATAAWALAASPSRPGTGNAA